ncbi:DUF1127 domain-containing protein [Lonsdalea quercina]|uniref:DUF1127 domain-containing protein n=1 Tax=Lonsdalea quercina TaxID=71657 RepID=UPI0039770BC2
MTQHHQHSQISTLHALFIRVYESWRERRLRNKTRALLYTMSDERLKDIGLSCADIDQCYQPKAFGKDGWLQYRNDAHKKIER